MRILTLTTLYPSAARPSHGVFVENRLRALLARGHDIRVVAPVPYFPSTAAVFGEYAQFAATPREEQRHGIPITHPRYTVLPKVGMTAAAVALTTCFADAIQQSLTSGFLPDLIDAHYYYPDGVAAIDAAARFHLPVVVTARGTDINLIPKYPRQRAMLTEAMTRAAHSVAVADALRDEMIHLGAAPDTVTTIRNGVDLETFLPPAERVQGVHLRLVSVGHLIERKGHHLVIDALTTLPDAELTIAGDGPMENALKAQVQRLGLTERVRFTGRVAHDKLKDVYGAADITVLASSREGWPNVLLESMACGTPCVATNVWGSGEVIRAPEAGELSEERTPASLAAAISRLAAHATDRAATRRYAEQFGWAPVAQSVETVWRKAMHAGWGSLGRLSEPKAAVRAVLTVDTEEAFDWAGNHHEWRLPDVGALEALQGMAEDIGVVPLYFTTYPLIEDEAIGGRLAMWVREGRADCGLHLHTWCTPPGEAPTSVEETFQCNIDPALHREKLRTLIRSFERRFGHRPSCHRAGRYGAAPWVLDQLAEEGILLDFSPSSGFDASHQGGPDFTRFGPSLRHRETQAGRQWVIPVSGARKYRGTSQYTEAYGRVGRSPLHHLRRSASVGVRLTPEGHSLQQMMTLTEHLIRQNAEILTPTIHLTSLMPAATPYAATADDAGHLLGMLRDWFSWASDQGIRPTKLSELESLKKDRAIPAV